MTDFDAGIKDTRITAADGFDEILGVLVAATRAAGAFLTVLECDLPAVSADGKGSFVAVKDIAVIVAFEQIRCPQPHLKHQIDIVMLECSDLRIRRLMVIVVE